MDGWERHLPPIAVQRLERAKGSHVAGSLLSAPAAAAIAAAGLEPVGEVMGCIVMHLGWQGYGCGQSYNQTWGTRYMPTPVLTSGSSRGSWQGFGPYVKARYHAFDTALTRMLAEAGALGADGVLGVRLTWAYLDSGARELVALGTAVRHKDPARRSPANTWPFATELSGEDVASALAGGWRPLGIAIGLSIAIKHDDWAMQWQTAQGFGNWNVEVDGLTALMTAARHEAREVLAARARRFPGAAHVVLTDTSLEVHEQACAGEDQRDHVAEATFMGTVLAHDPHHRPAERRSTLSILPLRSIN